MNIEIEVVGGTNKTVRAAIKISGEDCGQLQVERANFTKLMDLFFPDSYTIKGPATIAAPGM